MNLLRDAKDLNKLIKKSSIAANEGTKPTKVLFGTVTSISPLTISVEQKMTLYTAQLMLTRNVTNYTVSMTVDHLTENTDGGSGESSFASHGHGYKGTKIFTIQNGLTVGESVVLVRVKDGQKFLVLDRVVAT